MCFGLSEELLQSIREIFKQFPEVKKVKIFGSRALGKARPNSDVDLALFGHINRTTVLKIYDALEQLPVPYQFDIQLYSEITHPGVREHIDAVGKTIV